MNKNESKLNGIVFTIAYLPKLDRYTLVTMDNNIPVVVFALAEPENIGRVLCGEKLGTVVS